MSWESISVARGFQKFRITLAVFHRKNPGYSPEGRARRDDYLDPKKVGGRRSSFVSVSQKHTKNLVFEPQLSLTFTYFQAVFTVVFLSLRRVF